MSTDVEVAGYLRVASLSVALFDFIQTIPGEYRLYARQRRWKLTPACILFILVRYIGIVTLLAGNIGFFHHGFSPEVCKYYIWLPPIVKLMLALVSQTIISIRTYAVSRKAPWVFWALIVLFVATLVPELVGNFVHRIEEQNNGNCISGNLPGIKLGWLFYLGGMVFDAVTMAIATYYLYSSSAGLSMMSNLTRMMFGEGLIFFVALTSSNVLNVILYQSNNIPLQSSAATLSYANTMIFSERFILSLSDSAFAHSSRDRSNSRDAGPRALSHGGMFPRTTFLRGDRSFPGDKSAVELDIRVDKDVQITMDDLGNASTEHPRSMRDAFGGGKPKGAVSWGSE